MPPPLRAAGRLGVSYRPMTDEDLSFVAALYASTRTDELAPTGWPEEMKAAFLAQQHDAQHRHYREHYGDGEWLIVEREGAAIGRLYLHEAEDLRIIDISLVPAARGRGIGGAILSDVIDLARERGKALSIHVEKHNPARGLYLRLGFVPILDRGVYELMEIRP